MKNVLVVGASGGMGQEIAKKLLLEGYNVFGIDRVNNPNIEKLNYYKCDIPSEEQTKDVYSNISKDISNLFAIVFAAGIYKMDSLLEIDNERMKKILLIILTLVCVMGCSKKNTTNVIDNFKSSVTKSEKYIFQYANLTLI